MNNDTKPSLLQRVVALLCVMLLFASIGILMLFTPTIYASGAKSTQTTRTRVVPADTGTPIDTPSPTNTPIPPTNTPLPPTNTPTPFPTNTPLPPPTNTPIPQPTHTPVPVPKHIPPPQQTTAGGPPITPPTATSTVAAGNPPGTSSGTTIPGSATPSTQATSATGGSVLPPIVTNTTGSPTATPSNNHTAQRTATTSRSMSTTLIVGVLGLIAAALLAGLMWRRRQASKAQQKELVEQITPQYPMPWANGIVTNDAQYVQNASFIVGPVAPHENTADEETIRMPNTPIPPADTPNNAIDPFLEAMMRQAQMGLFVVPGKEELS